MLNVMNLIRCKPHYIVTDNGPNYCIIPANPATGILYITEKNPEFISGHVRMKGKNGGQYPYHYLEMIENIFGTVADADTIEVCSGSVTQDCFKVDINPSTNPDFIGDGQKLDGISDERFGRWRCDPPYNQNTAKSMYGTALPNTIKLLKAGARVCKIGSLMFLLGHQNYQWHPKWSKKDWLCKHNSSSKQ